MRQHFCDGQQLEMFYDHHLDGVHQAVHDSPILSDYCCQPKCTNWENLIFLVCDYRGIIDETAEGNCTCKIFVEGKACNTCHKGFWNLTQDNENGCQRKYLNQGPKANF